MGEPASSLPCDKVLYLPVPEGGEIREQEEGCGGVQVVLVAAEDDICVSFLLPLLVGDGSVPAVMKGVAVPVGIVISQSLAFVLRSTLLCAYVYFVFTWS